MMMKKTLTLVVAVSCVLALSACNTVRGFGTDLTKAGELLVNSADNSQQKIKPVENEHNFPGDKAPRHYK